MGDDRLRLAPAEASPYAGHLPALDGIRGFAALGVIGSHLFRGGARGFVQNLIASALSFGATGVDLFFVLSGFLITGILYDSLAEPRFFQKFYARRALRIFPLYYGVLFLFLVAAWFQHSDYNGQLIATAVYLQNTYLIAPPVWIPSGHLVLPLAHFWSLAIEEQFYLLWPLLVSLIKKREHLVWFCVASFIACPLLRIEFAHLHILDTTTHANMFCRADSLLAGAAFSLLLRGRSHDRALRLSPWLFTGGALLCWLLWNGHFGHGAFASILSAAGFHYTALAACAVGLIGMALSVRPVKSICSFQPLRDLGKYSYGLYVYHVPLFILFQAPVRTFLTLHVTANKAIVLVLTGLAIFALTFIASFLSYQLFEKRFLRLKRYFDYRSHHRKVRAVASGTAAV